MKKELHDYLILQKYNTIGLVYQGAVGFKKLLISHNFIFKEDGILIKDYENGERFFSYKQNIAVFINWECFWKNKLIEHFNSRKSNNFISFHTNKWVYQVFNNLTDLTNFTIWMI